MTRGGRRVLNGAVSHTRPLITGLNLLRYSALVCWILPALLLGCSTPAPVAKPPAASPPPPQAAKPVVYLIGDSTVNNGTRGQMGWGSCLGAWIQPGQAALQNRARGGRSSRTFLTEGLWAKTLEEIKPGDVVLMQFGHNDGGGLNDPRNRASIKGNGEETREITRPDGGAPETVHSYGWYLRRYIADAKAKGALPVVLSPVPRNMWTAGKINRAKNDYGKWAAEAAAAAGALFVDLNEIVATRYEAAGQDKTASDYFGAADHTHTLPAGARVNAACVVEGLKALPGNPMGRWLREQPEPAP